MNHEVFAALGEALKRGEDVALVTIVSANGSTPQRVGAKMLVFADGRTVGHYRRRLLRERRLLEGARGAEASPRRHGALRARGRFRRGERTHLRRPDGGLHRAHRAGAGALHLRRRPRRPLSRRGWRTRPASRFTSSTTGRSSPTPSVSRTPSRSWSTTFPNGWPARPCPPQPMRSSSRAGIVTISMRCVRSRHATCGISG